MGQAYAARENPVPTGPGGGINWKSLFSLEFVSTKWPRIFFGLVSLQAILCLVFEAFVHPHPIPLRALA